MQYTAVSNFAHMEFGKSTHPLQDACLEMEMLVHRLHSFIISTDVARIMAMVSLCLGAA